MDLDELSNEQVQLLFKQRQKERNVKVSAHMENSLLEDEITQDVRDGVESKPEALDRGNLVVLSGSRGVVTQMEGGAVDIADGSAKDGVRQIPAGLTCSSSRDGKKVRRHEEATAEADNPQ